MKRILAALAFILLAVLPVRTEPQAGRIITITAGTAIRLATTKTLASSMLIQALPGSSTGLIYVLNSNPQATCANAGAGTTLVAELAAATTTAPGGAFTFPSNGSSATQASGFDVQFWCIDGSHTGDTVAVSWDVRR